jgi:hypothetical protein
MSEITVSIICEGLEIRIPISEFKDCEFINELKEMKENNEIKLKYLDGLSISEFCEIRKILRNEFNNYTHLEIDFGIKIIQILSYLAWKDTNKFIEQWMRNVNKYNGLKKLIKLYKYLKESKAYNLKDLSEDHKTIIIDYMKHRLCTLNFEDLYQFFLKIYED